MGKKLHLPVGLALVRFKAQRQMAVAVPQSHMTRSFEGLRDREFPTK